MCYASDLFSVFFSVLSVRSFALLQCSVAVAPLQIIFLHPSPLTKIRLLKGVINLLRFYHQFTTKVKTTNTHTHARTSYYAFSWLQILAIVTCRPNKTHIVQIPIPPLCVNVLL